MNTSPLEIKAALQIGRPIDEVFEAIVDPATMSNYFISYGSGRMEEGKELTWRFPEFDMDIPVRVGKVEKDKYVSYYWDNEDKQTLVEIALSSYKDHTVVTVTEKSMNNDEAGIKWLKGNTEGWANFLACLKAWLEYGVHLRKHAFDFRFTPEP
jgi:uncharacterized protein YndB with AHSA1/START domain